MLCNSNKRKGQQNVLSRQPPTKNPVKIIHDEQTKIMPENKNDFLNNNQSMAVGTDFHRAP